MVEIFIKEYLSKNPAFPVGFDIEKLNKWYELLYPEVDDGIYLTKALEEIKLALAFQTLPVFDKYQYLRGHQQKHSLGSQFFHPDHLLLFQKLESVKHTKGLNLQNTFECAFAKGFLIEELFRFEVENFEAFIIANLFLENTERDIESQKILLLEIKQFKNLKPRESLFTLSSFNDRNFLVESEPISNEKIDSIIVEIDSKIRKSFIKNLEFERKTSKVDPENKNDNYGLNLNLPDDQLGMIYEELVKQKYFHREITKKNFINAFNGEKLSNDYKKIKWNHPVDLSIIIGLYAGDKEPWKKATFLFDDSKSLAQLFYSAKAAKKYRKKETFFNSIFKNNSR